MFRRRATTPTNSRSPFSPKTQAAVASAIAIPPPAEAQAAFSLGNKLQIETTHTKRRPLKRATSQWKKAATLGHVDATHVLGLQALQHRRPVLAFEYLIKAADAGHTDSCYHVGRMYLQGEGVERDAQRGIEYLERAVEKQYSKANRALGQFYATDPDAKDEAKTVQYYTTAVAGGEYAAHCELGDLYHAMDQLELAVQQYRHAVKRGDRHAMFRLGMCHVHGCGVSPEPRRAAELLREAGDQFSFPTNYAIAQRFEKGDGVARDPSTAVMFYQFAWEAAVEEGNDLETIYLAETALLRLQAPFDPTSGRVKNCMFKWLHHLSAL